MAQSNRKGIVDRHRVREDVQDLSTLSSPQKKIKISSITRCNESFSDKSKQDEIEYSSLVTGSSDDVTDIKLQTLDYVDTKKIKDDITICLIDASIKHNTAHNNLQIAHKSSAEPCTTIESDIQPNKNHTDKINFLARTEPVSTSLLGLYNQPDSSTGAHKSRASKDKPQHQSFARKSEATSSPCLSTISSCAKVETSLCQVCGDLAAGFYCQAYICEACKKFFIRASKLDNPKYVCLRSKDCSITKESRVHCQYCRYQKCLQLNMSYPKDGHMNGNKIEVEEIPCSVCSAPSSGFHFGAITCEGCKGFFRRMVKEREAYSYKCSKSGSCEINAKTRNMCKSCRYNKCLNIGMSVEGCRIGRQPNAIKHALSLEVRKQAALKTEIRSDNEKNMDSNLSHITLESATIDHFISSEIDNGLHSTDLSQVSSSADIYKPPLNKSENITQELEPQFCYYQLNNVVTAIKHDDLITASLNHSNKDQDNVQLPGDNYMPTNSSFPLSLNSSSISATVHRSFESNMFSDPHTKDGNSQPQDLCIDLSKPRAQTTGFTNTSSHQSILHTTSRFTSVLDHSSIISSSNHTRLLLPPLNVQSTSYNYPIDYTNYAQQTMANIKQYVDHDKYMKPAYHNVEKCEINTPYNKSNSFNSEETNFYSNCHKPQHDLFVNKMFAQSTNTINLENHYLSHFSDNNTLQYKSQDQKEPLFYHHYVPEPFLKNEAYASRQSNINETHPQATGYQTYKSQIKEKEISFRSIPNVPNFQRRLSPSPEPQNVVLSHQIKAQSCANEQSQPIGYAVLCSASSREAAVVSQCQSTETRLSPRSYYNDSSNGCSNINVVPEKENVYGSNNCINMSNKELHVVLLDAAKNLLQFCVLSRAKSDIFEAERFKDVDSTWDKMMEHFNFHAKCIVRFAKKIPGFRSLKIDDQVLLLRMATYSLVIFNHSRVYEPDTGFYNYFNFNEREIQRIRVWQ